MEFVSGLAETDSIIPPRCANIAQLCGHAGRCAALVVARTDAMRLRLGVSFTACPVFSTTADYGLIFDPGIPAIRIAIHKQIIGYGNRTTIDQKPKKPKPASPLTSKWGKPQEPSYPIPKRLRYRQPPSVIPFAILL